MNSHKTLDVASLIDESRFGTYQLLIATLCSLCLVMDGFDAQAMGYVAPSVIRDWHIAKEALSPVFSAALLGMLVGSLAFSTLADKIGRRPVLVGATLFFAVCMIATGFADSIAGLLGWRFLAGIGLGCIMPNAMALAGEYSPRRIRITLMMIVSCGYTVGGVVGGFISAALIPAFGWRSVFFAGGVFPLVIGVVMLIALPESLQFLLFRSRTASDDARVRRQVERISSKYSTKDTFFTTAESRSNGVPFIELFKAGRARVTVLLWILNFANLLDMYFLSNWLPTVLHEAGYTTSIAVLAGSALWGGGVIGTVLLGRLIERFGFTRVLAAIFLMVIFTIAVIGNPRVMATAILMFVSIFLTGFTVMGGQPAINSLAAIYYPTSLRSTGIGWSLGIGRVGSVIGPLLGGMLMHLNWSVQSLFLAAAVPACVSLLSIIAIHLIGHGEKVQSSLMT